MTPLPARLDRTVGLPLDKYNDKDPIIVVRMAQGIKQWRMHASTLTRLVRTEGVDIHTIGGDYCVVVKNSTRGKA